MSQGPAAGQEPALPVRIRLRALHRMAGRSSGKLRAPSDVILRSCACTRRALGAPVVGDAVVLASRKALCARRCPVTMLGDGLVVVVVVVVVVVAVVVTVPMIVPVIVPVLMTVPVELARGRNR